jgi:hypothetical protein
MSPQEDKELQDLLNDFKDVFEEPVGLPPQRQCDHSKLGLNLLELDHTGFPISKKTEMEQQIKQLLESSVIRPSKSPYASPSILVRKPSKSPYASPAILVRKKDG